ncbi:hypothetical protein SVIOM74S_04204 [Streptomyces violarus]
MRVEAVDVAQEFAPPGVGQAGRRRVRVVPAAAVPALRGDLGDGVAALGQGGPELVEVVGGRIAAGQADDGDGVGVVLGGFGDAGPCGTARDARRARGGDFGRGRDRCGRLCAAGQLGRVVLGEVAGEFTQGGVLEEQGLGQGVEVPVQLAVELGDHQRVDAEPVERGVLGQFGRVNAGLGGDQLAQQPQGLVARAAALGGRGGRGGPGRPGDGRGERGGDGAEVSVGGDERAGGAEGLLEQGEADVCGQYAEAGAGGDVRGGLGALAHPAVGRHRPGDRGDAAVPFGVGLQVGVGVRVVGLAGVADVGGDGGEGDEEVQRVVGGGLVQGAQSGGLGGEDGGEVLGGLGQGVAVAQHTGGMHDTGERPELLAYGGESSGQGVRIGHVDAAVDQALVQVGGPFAAAQQDHAGVGPGEQPAGDGAAQSAGPARHDVHAAVADCCRAGGRGRLGLRDPAALCGVGDLRVAAVAGQFAGERVGLGHVLGEADGLHFEEGVLRADGPGEGGECGAFGAWAVGVVAVQQQDAHGCGGSGGEERPDDVQCLFGGRFVDEDDVGRGGRVEVAGDRADAQGGQVSGELCAARRIGGDDGGRVAEGRAGGLRRARRSSGGPTGPTRGARRGRARRGRAGGPGPGRGGP